MDVDDVPLWDEVPCLKTDVDGQLSVEKVDADVPISKFEINHENKSAKKVVEEIDESAMKVVEEIDESAMKVVEEIDGREGLEDAALAGGCRSSECTLILTEGMSAKAFVMTFASYLGSEKFGIYPIKGKIKNVRNLRKSGNMLEELDNDSRNIAKALGILPGSNDFTGLRYGSILLMTDQDGDGIHIKGLLMNLFHHLWSKLLEVDGFLQDFNTNLIKAKNSQTGAELFFQSSVEQKMWEDSLSPGELDNWRMKYYKGLASNTDKEAFQYAKNMKKHLRSFKACKSSVDKDELNMWMKTAFCKNSSDSRKKWLLKDVPVPDYSKKKITISKYIEEELPLFHRESIQRSISCVVDGFKPSQRKVFFYLSEIENIDQKVYHLSGKVSEATCYHHGDKVLEGVIIRMAQDFIGSNNLNLLEPNGQFGSRRQAGHDHGEPRYINTELSAIARLLFPDVDNDLVTHKREDGKWVEPNWYAPIAPLILINGTLGIATGYCSRIPSYNLTHVIENLRLLMDKKETKKMVPWYRGFEGTVEPLQNEGTYRVTANWKCEGTELKILDLPPGVWLEKYEKTLADKKRDNTIKDYKKVTKSGKVCFEIDLIESMEDSELVKSFGLSKKVTTNIVLLDAKGRVKPYDSIEQVMKEFFDVRKKIYEDRKRKLLERLETELENAEQMQKMAIQHEIDVLNVKHPEELWKEDLKKLEDAWNRLIADQDQKVD